MSCEVKALPSFAKAAKKLAKRYKSFTKDLLSLIHQLEVEPTKGVDLGNGFRKVRMPIASKNKGKSGGARVITLLLVSSPNAQSLGLLTVYDKSDRETISDKEIECLKRENGL